MNQPAKSISKVFLAFLLSSESRQGGCRGLLKRCIRRVGGQVVHVEPVFLFDDGDVISVVVNIDEKVEFWKRDGQVHYNTAYWDCVGLAMSPEERVRMYHFCVEQNGKPFNKRGLYCNFLPVLHGCFGTADDDQSTWFCSHLIMAAMQYAKPGGVFDEYRASRITPEQLRAIMRSKHQYSVVNTYMGNADNLELKWAEEGGKMV